MNPVTTAVTLNMQLPNIATVTWAVQGDQLSRYIQCTLVDGSTAWLPESGYHGVVRFHKPDGTAGIYDVDEDGNPAVTWVDNVATVTLAHQALTVAGTVLMQLEFYDSNSARITAFGWAMNVQPAAVTDTEFLSTDYYNILSLQIAGVLGATGHAPYIDSVTKNWMIWDEDTNAYVNSGYSSEGTPGPAPEITGTDYQYANSNSGTTVPTSWSDTRPATVPGSWAWTKIIITFNNADQTIFYSVAYQGNDGTGAAGSSLPLMDGTAAVGTAIAYSREDHVHPTDTSRASVNCDCIILGNSWVTGGTNAGFTAGGWGNYFSTYYTKGTIFNGAVSGAKVTSGDYLTQFNTIVSGNDISSVGLVLISGFITCDSGTFASAFGALISAIREELPNARIIAVSPDCSTDATYQINNMTLNAVVDSSCNFNGVPCLFLQNDIRYNVNWFGGTNNFHVNPSAAQKIARMISQYIDGKIMSRFTDIEEAGNANQKMFVQPDGKIGVQLYPYNASGTTVSGTGNIYTIPSIVIPGALLSGISIPAIIRVGSSWDQATLIGSNGSTNVYYYGTFTGQLRNVNFDMPQDVYALRWLV